METISVATLRTWLEEHRDMLDVRPASDYQEWAIPGSVHVDTYEALKRRDPRALADLHLDTARQVVTVCAAGKTSQVAAEHLAAWGLQVFSLEGGMQAWSLAWNTAEIVLSPGSVRVVQVRRTGKGCLSYLIGDGETALVIDASLDPQMYLDLAAGLRWQITHVLDTHIHTDHLSRSRQLARQSGACLCLPDQPRVSFPFLPLHDGTAVETGSMHLTSIRTPGHSEESTCYLLNGQVLLSGDMRFPTGVGRPAPVASSGQATERAEALYESLQMLASTPVLAGHTSRPVPFDGVPVMTTLAEVRYQVDLLQCSRADFMRGMLERLPVTPPNDLRIVKRNGQGNLPHVPVPRLEAGANRCAVC
jgi:glyoxylase-like metal-dependent hydrolase (beta-lactamase superfamily II)/rhodanese-related sulfurtransferase